MNDDFNSNLNNEPVTPPVPDSGNPQPAFDYQPPQVEIPQAPVFDAAPVNADVTTAQTDTPPAYTFGQQPVQTEVPQQNPYQPNAQGYQPQQNPYQPNAQGYQPQQNPYQPNAQGYQPQQDHTYSSGYYQYTPVNPAMVNAQNQTDGFAIASLILGITGICTCCTFIPAILGLIFGIVSKSTNDGTRPTGVSTAGIITSVVALLINIFFLVIGLAE
ncbi:MAG: DUF4190 domain-containing protein [Acutalibacteraceae bacterium]|nr:DUF4190 domain-containing protein [Bacillota bacterium]